MLPSMRVECGDEGLRHPTYLSAHLANTGGTLDTWCTSPNLNYVDMLVFRIGWLDGGEVYSHSMSVNLRHGDGDDIARTLSYQRLTRQSHRNVLHP